MPVASSPRLPATFLRLLRRDLRRLWAPAPALAQRMLDDHRALIGLSLMMIGPFAAALWVWDWANDPAGAAHTVGLRLLFLLLLPTGMIVLALRRPLVVGLLLEGTLVWTVALYSMILARQAGGMQYGVGAYAVFYVFALFILSGLPLIWSLAFAVLMPLTPHAMALAGWLPGFPHLPFALLMWPMSGCMLMLYLLGARGYLRRLDLERQLEAASNADPLTGVSNRRHFMPRVAEALQGAQRQARALAVAMIDLDHFKHINDAHGHAAGDDVIRAFAELCRQGLRGQDVVARMGGEEFALLLPGLGEADALPLAERLRRRAQELGVRGPQGEAIRFTVSIGVASLSPGDDAGSLLARADAALYEAKASGRNRVVGAACAGSEAQPPWRASRSLFQ